MANKLKLTEKNPEELKAMLAKEREELRNLRFAAAGSRPKDSAAPSKARKNIARFLTEMHARKLSVMNEGAVEGMTITPAQTSSEETA